MAYDEDLADRIRVACGEVAAGQLVLEKRMFGGLAFLVGGHIAVAAVSRGAVMLRVDPAHTPQLLALPGVTRMVMRDRELDGWLLVEPGVVEGDDELRRWVERGVTCAQALPPR